ncbi:hypothetical protein [Mycobacterium kubicae]|uniref:hypothetical protein n=1 Tax=Mycobacterium kubicae TaxID=120959 RepID=UPI0008014A77|nr:hypothetical protein [Mycobacterium kubicae]OBF15491.1 hypothetical protein A5725_04715 [Mycobacterium kubicae]OBK53868.1 hypothetical protein A5657_14405 [Mycobacterium kubicae]QNI08984.1 hypothetical protein GAN17_24115 [Mycobacterium kubicae]
MHAADDLPLPDYDQLALGDLRHRIRSLEQTQLQTLIDHEQVHGGRAPVLQVLHARLEELRSGAQPSGGNPQNTPEVHGTTHGSPVQEVTAAEANTPLRHGVAYQTPKRGRP